MSSPPIETTHNSDTLVIETNATFTLETFNIEVLSYLGQFTTDIYYFQVNISPIEDGTTPGQPGLLRVGATASALSRELQLRETLGDYKMLAPLLAHTSLESVTININSSSPIPNPEPEPEESNYLEEEYYPEAEIISDSCTSKVILLTHLPAPEQTLATWLQQHHSLEESLLLTGQVCQFLRYVHQRQWCFISIIPQFIQMGTLIQFFDLTSAYPLEETLPSGLLGNYCAPELAYGKNPIQEAMSSYTVAALLYHSTHQHTIPQEQSIDLNIHPIPGIYQILSTCLSPIPEQRFSLSQLISILVANRQTFSNLKIQWNIASSSTLGLSTNRLQNEDNYGVKHQQLSDEQTMIIAVVADGMGGMSQGEVASKLAVQTVLEEPITSPFKTPEQRNQWLMALFAKVNQSVANNVKDGGTTLSVIIAIAQQLMIAHVGDSRIYLLRQGQIQQLSEDHSLIAMLSASGQITPEESINHPDRNVLTKFIGAKQRLSDGYVQNLTRTQQKLSMQLENQDILLLCSDGVWDLVRENELVEIFNHEKNLQVAVDQTIQQVLNQGAPDNATLLALQCRIDKIYSEIPPI
ncbi:protein phosphatase 2C domain-containing protein [Chrysosporum bergii ANA360D]|uniref:Protein phosphatase 2C domain-containing protein n=1 Tax=Chrysosporum bergii ANA360D TaxID=617107 RepID=A0AA43KA43_9CYAN|nr:protein phosphatase 2C domain-containing protein [Chrysosporum bergii]MDH6058947.1 protein phosphatase 2C domain-containing protein [Chrysosporum bergii ANA360D]